MFRVQFFIVKGETENIIEIYVVESDKSWVLEDFVLLVEKAKKYTASASEKIPRYLQEFFEQGADIGFCLEFEEKNKIKDFLEE